MMRTLAGFFAAGILVAGAASGCPWHGAGAHPWWGGGVGAYAPEQTKDAPGGGGETLVVRVTDHLQAANNAEVAPGDGFRQLKPLHGYRCTVARIVGDDGPAVPLYELACADKDDGMERVRHQCGAGKPEARWQGVNPMGMTVVTVTMTCI